MLIHPDSHTLFSLLMSAGVEVQIYIGRDNWLHIIHCLTGVGYFWPKHALLLRHGFIFFSRPSERKEQDVV